MPTGADSSGSDTLLQAGDKTCERHAASLANASQFQDIQTPLPGFVFRHEALRPVKALRELLLPEAALDPEIPEKAA